MLIREATREEWVRLSELALAAYDQYREASSAEFWELYSSNIRASYVSDERPLRLIAMLDSDLAGCVLLYPPHKGTPGDPRPHSDYPEMRLLAVDPRVRNAGVGRALIEECERRAQADGADAITLHTSEMMSVAKGMYERKNYERYPILDFEPVPGLLVMGFKKGLN